jgi:hypothetical protein
LRDGSPLAPDLEGGAAAPEETTPLDHFDEIGSGAGRRTETSRVGRKSLRARLGRWTGQQPIRGLHHSAHE